MSISVAGVRSTPDVDENMNRPKRPGSLSLLSPDSDDSELTNGKQKLQDPSFSTLLTPGGGTLDITPLPDRYVRLRECRVPENGSHEPPCSPDGRERRRDMDTAIRWIKQELMLMKQQDRLLMRQLLNLRSKIHQIRSNRLCHSFGTDLYSSDESWVSFASDEALSAPCTNSPVTEAEMLASFKSRTVSMMSAPTSPDHSTKLSSTPKLTPTSMSGSKLNKIIDITYYV